MILSSMELLVLLKYFILIPHIATRRRRETTHINHGMTFYRLFCCHYSIWQASVSIDSSRKKTSSGKRSIPQISDDIVAELQEHHFIIQCSIIIRLTWLMINMFGIFPLSFLLFRNTMTTVEFAAIPTPAIRLWRITITSDVDSLSSVEELSLEPLHSWQIDESLKILEVVLSILMRVCLTGNRFKVVHQQNGRWSHVMIKWFSPLALKVSEKMWSMFTYSY